MQQNSYKNYFQKLFSFILCVSVLSGSFAASAQTRRTTTTKTSTPKTPPANNPTKPGAEQQYKPCNGGWSGIITYTKRLKDSFESDEPGIRKDKDRIKHRTSRDYMYFGRVVVDGSQKEVVTKSNVVFTDRDNHWSENRVWESCGNRGDTSRWQIIEGTDDRYSEASAQGELDSFHLSVNPYDGTYSFAVRFPEAKGNHNREIHVKRSGFCQPRNNLPSDKIDNYPITEGGGFSVDEQKVDPKNTDVLSGSKTWDNDSTLKSANFVYTVTWSFKKCPAPVEVTDVKFFEHPYPDPKKWDEVEDGEQTIDGNRVLVRAKVLNLSPETRYATVKFRELVEDWVLPDGEKQIRLEPGEETEVELEWDTSGYAWKGKGWDADSKRRVQVDASADGYYSKMIKPITVSPRPVILVHGLWSNGAAWAGYEKFFHEGHSVYWETYAVGANPSVAKMNTGESFGNTAPTNSIYENSLELGKQIEFARKDLSAWHVDVVAHSMGGLITRHYINTTMPASIDEKPVVTRLIMLGTPNMGSPCADLMYPAMALAGHKIMALWELKPGVVEEFNRRFADRRGVRFSALVGKALPKTCQSSNWGDGVVEINSAKWTVKDWKFSNSLAHTDLTSRADFGAFVFPRLSIGPRGDHKPSLALSESNQNENYADSIQPSADRYGFNSAFRKASFQREVERQTNDNSPVNDGKIEGVTMAKEVKITPMNSAEIDVPVSNGSRAAIVFVASPNVSATLTDAAGNIVGKNLANTPEAKQMFRTISIDKPVTGGTWKLKLESRETTETIAYVVAFTDANPLAFEITAGKPTATKQVLLQAKLINQNSPVTGATVKAKLQSESGQTSEIVLVDDGQHGDGAANDGVYGATTEKFANGEYFVEAKAETNGQTRTAVTSFIIGTTEVKKPAAVKKAK